MTIPTAPANLVATAASSSQINLTWADNSNNETGFKVERAPGGTTNFVEITTVGSNVMSHQNTGLSASTSYSYRVRAYNSAGDLQHIRIRRRATTQAAVTIPTAPAV